VTGQPRPWRVLLRLALVGVTLATGCNSLFGIHEGKPRTICDDKNLAEPPIDDMEDGDGFICALNGWNGHWYTAGDGTSADLIPTSGFEPTLIADGKRDTSRYAAHFAGSGFTYWGALMGFDFIDQGLGTRPIDASRMGGSGSSDPSPLQRSDKTNPSTALAT